MKILKPLLLGLLIILSVLVLLALFSIVSIIVLKGIVDADLEDFAIVVVVSSTVLFLSYKLGSDLLENENISQYIDAFFTFKKKPPNQEEE